MQDKAIITELKELNKKAATIESATIELLKVATEILEELKKFDK